MNLCNVMFVQLAGRQAVFCGKNLNTGHYVQTVQPNLYIPAILIGTIDFYHFILLSMTLTEVRRLVAQSKTYWLLAHFSSDQDEIWCVDKQFKLNIPRLLLSKIYWNKGDNCCATDCVKNLKFACILMFMNGFEPNLVWYYYTLHFDTSLSNLDLDSRSQESEKAKFLRW